MLCKTAVGFGLLLCISVCTGELQLSGHETPVYVGLSRIITCEWTGTENITKLEWYLVGLERLGLGIKLFDRMIGLNPGRVTDISWNGKMFVCKATLASGSIVQKRFALWVKEFMHEINIIQPCAIAIAIAPIAGDNHTFTAGDNHTLTCTVNSELPANLKWVRILNGHQFEVENTSTITVSAQIVSDRITKKTITFKSLLTSHGGRYVCVSRLNIWVRIALSTKELERTVKVKIPPPTVQLISDTEAVTSKHFSLTAFISLHPSVDTPIDIDSSWYGHLSLLGDGQRVIVSDVKGQNSTYNRSVLFVPLISSDEGSYFFSARVRSSDSQYIFPSSIVNDSINILPNISVTIKVTYNPSADFILPSPPYFLLATSVTLTCHVEGTSRPVSYHWTSTNPNSFVMNNRSSTVSKTRLTSNDAGNHTCYATNSGGNTSFDTIAMQIIGLTVTIKVTYNPPADYTLPSPPYFRPATSVTLTCHVEEANGSVSYQWSSTGPNSFAVNSRTSVVSKTILTSDDAGNHTCCATDSTGNTGSSTIEMQIIGGGVFVTHSKHLNNKALANNSVVILEPSACQYCRLVFYCYSNSSNTNKGYIIFPNDQQYYDNSSIYDVEIRRLIPSGIRFRNYISLTPHIDGIYTCQLPDSNGNILNISIAYYSSDPRPPYIYYSTYFDLSDDGEENTLFGMIEIKTKYSPPTNVTWQRDGVTVYIHPQLEGAGYKMIQNITNKTSSYYISYLLIKNYTHLAGNHTYTCIVQNSIGRASRNVSTHMQVDPQVSIHSNREPIHDEEFILTCTATILPVKLAPHLLQHTILEWLGPDGEVLTNSNNYNIIVEQYIDIFRNEIFKTLIFFHLSYHNKNTYRCSVKVAETDVYNVSSFYIDIIERTIIQLKFVPMLHCSEWYKYAGYIYHLEYDIKTALEAAIYNGHRYGYYYISNYTIDQGEFTCNQREENAIYRARITIFGEVTEKLYMLLDIIDDWIAHDGSFLSTYDGRIRLWVDRDSSLRIPSFTERFRRSLHGNNIERKE